METFAVRLSEDERTRLDAWAKDHGMRSAEVIRAAFNYYISPDYGKGFISLADITRSKVSESTEVEVRYERFLRDVEKAQDKAALIEEEPGKNNTVAENWYQIFAATAHKLADDNGLPVPAWCLKDEYFDHVPIWATTSDDRTLREYLEMTTPREFVWHNVFLGENAMKIKE